MAKMTGARFLAEAIHGYGVSRVFVVRTVLTPTLAAMGSLGIARVMTHGEKAAAYMTDAYARARRRRGAHSGGRPEGRPAGGLARQAVSRRPVPSRPRSPPTGRPSP